MWKRGGRSFALDRAQALLSGRRGGGGDGRSSAGRTQLSVGGSFKARSDPPNTHNLFSDLSDLSSVSSAPELAGEDVRATDAEKNHGRAGDLNKDLRPQSSLGGGSRFLKKAPPPTNSSQSPVRRNQMHPEPKSKCASSSQRTSQTAALTRLAEIESRHRSRKQVQEQAKQATKPALDLTSDMEISPPQGAAAAAAAAAVTRFAEAPVQLAAESGSDQSPRGKRFLKNKAAGAVESTSASPKRVDASVRSTAAGSVAPSGGLEAKSGRLMTSVSLESDEEDMRKLLGDSMDSDYTFLKPERPSAMKKPDKVFSTSSRRVHSGPPPPAIPSSLPSGTAPPRSPASPPHRSSPFRFTGQAQARFSPSRLSPSPSPPHISSSPVERLGSSHGVESPRRSLSSASGRGEVLSLEELFPAAPGCEGPHSEMSSVSSEDFKMNVMSLDDLAPSSLGFAVETPGKAEKAKQGAPIPGSPDRNHQQVQEEERQQQELLDYQSDFESESWTEPHYSASQVSEHLQGDGGEAKVVSEVGDEVSDSDVSQRRTEDDYSRAFSDTSRSSTSQTSDRSHMSESYSRSRSEDSRASVSHETSTSSERSKRRSLAKKDLKEVAVQTRPVTSTWPTGITSLDPTVGMAYIQPSPVLTHAISAEMVEAISGFNPPAFALNELLKQQLAMTRRFIESSRHLHASLVQSLEPPNYKYTTLEDTKEFIHKRRSPKLTMEEALQAVQQEMKDYH